MIANSSDVFAHELLFLWLLYVILNLRDLGALDETFVQKPVLVFNDSFMPFTLSHSIMMRFLSWFVLVLCDKNENTTQQSQYARSFQYPNLCSFLISPYFFFSFFFRPAMGRLKSERQLLPSLSYIIFFSEYITLCSSHFCLPCFVFLLEIRIKFFDTEWLRTSSQSATDRDIQTDSKQRKQTKT